MNKVLLQQGWIQDPLRRQERVRKGIFVQIALFVLLLAILTLFLLVFRGNPKPHPPSSYNPHASGFLGLYRSLRALGVNVRRNRHSFPLFLSSESDPKRDCFVLLDPQISRMNGTQQKAFLSWIEKGGQLLLTQSGFSQFSLEGIPVAEKKDPFPFGALLVGAPKLLWSPLGGSLRGKGPLRDLHLSLPYKAGIENKLPRALVLSEALEGNEGRLTPPRPTEKGKEWGITAFGRPYPKWKVLSEYRGRPLLLEREMGKGRILLCSTPLPFTNYACGGMGTGLWALRTLLLASQGYRRRIVFDEWSHGFALKKGFFHFLKSARLLYPLLGLLLLYLVLIWRGLVRPGPIPPRKELPRRSKEEYIFAQARLLDLSKKYKAAARWLFEGYDLRIQKETGRQDWPRRKVLRNRLASLPDRDRAAFEAFGRKLDKVFRDLVPPKSSSAPRCGNTSTPTVQAKQ